MPPNVLDENSHTRMIVKTPVKIASPFISDFWPKLVKIQLLDEFPVISQSMTVSLFWLSF